ncbi:MAG: cysteine desulfurase NifS [Chloroflexi bacterium]|nr:cysteine desulfurase NifS [Chloroflexota bacterium]
MRRIYLDDARTTPVRPEVVQAMLPYFTDVFGNPSTIYACGQEAKGAIEEARSRVADLIGAGIDEIVFTSGGTEADNFAIKGVVHANESRGKHIITTPIEHHAVLETCHFLEENGCRVTYLPVDGNGLVDPAEVRRAIASDTVLISIMHANNEVGTIEPIAEIGKVAREAGVYFHTDAVQTAGHLPVNVDEMGVDLLSMSAHKLYGPKGIGALYIRKGTRLVTFMHGGEQERGRRASTENVPGIVGFGHAVALAGEEMSAEAERLTSLRNRLIDGLMEKIDHTRLNGHPTQRLPNNANVSIAYVEGESMCLNLDFDGICVSTGSACSSASTEPSHVMLALGMSPLEAHSSLRMSLGRWTTEEDIATVLEVLPRVVGKLRAMSPLLKNQ